MPWEVDHFVKQYHLGIRKISTKRSKQKRLEGAGILILGTFSPLTNHQKGATVFGIIQTHAGRSIQVGCVEFFSSKWHFSERPKVSLNSEKWNTLEESDPGRLNFWLH